MRRRPNTIESVPSYANPTARPVVVRSSPQRQTIFTFLLIAFVAVVFFVLPNLNSNAVLSTSFSIENVNLTSSSVPGGSSWLVTGNLINTTRETRKAPELQVRLLRQDDSVAAEEMIDMRGQQLPAGAAVRFQLRLQTGPNEALRARVKPVE